MIELSEPPLTRGIVRFRPHLAQQQIITMANQKPLSLLLEEEEWDMTVRRFEELISKGTLRQIDDLGVRSLKIRWGTCQKIIPAIRQIRFPCLKELQLNGNLIESIEGLSSLNLSSLEVLNLKQNNITTLRTLRKCVFPVLKELNLYKNRILELRILQDLHAPCLTLLWVAPQRDCFVAQQPSSWIFKLESSHLAHIFIKHPAGRNLDFEEVKTMSEANFKRVELVYQIKDDTSVRRE